MNLLQTRLGLLAPNTTPLWTGTANGAQSEAFALAVTTVSGTLPTDTSGLLLVRTGLDFVRIKSHSGSTLYLAENPATFTAGDTLAVYDLRLPWPRYQRLVSTTVYKDYDIAFPAAWQQSLPPAALVTPEVAWLEVGDTQVFSALNSQIMAPDPTGGLTATWDCTGWGTGTAYGSAGGVTNCYFPLTATATGLHYLKCTLTDEWGGAFSRYAAVWVGTTPTAVLGASLEWSLERGWRGGVTLDGTPAWWDFSPVALVDLDTREIVFYGFYRPQRVSGDLGLATTESELLSPLNAAAALYGYPFIVTDLADPGSTPPDNWAEVGKLTCARALWYLLVWHSVLPQLVNLALGDPTARRIAGQTFSAGNLLNLIDQVTQAAFYVLRAARAGALTLEVQPLYADAATWAALPTYTLAASARSAAYTYTPAQARCSEVRVSGVYLAVGDDYAPAIARCPAHPAAWGAGTQEVTKLAPLSAAELLQWAGRHFAVENQAATVDAAVLVEIDPATYARVTTDIPGAATVALDSLRLTFDPVALSWQTQLGGRTYSAAPGADYVPIPPAVVIPAPTPPPVLPPLDPLPPIRAWPTIVYVATSVGGIYRTENFGGPEDDQPTWVLDNAIAGGGELTNIRQLGGDPTYRDVQYCVNDSDDTVYAHTTPGGTWTAIIDNAYVRAALGDPAAYICMFDVALDGTLWVTAINTVNDTVYFFSSGDYGATWSAPVAGSAVGENYVRTLLVEADYIWFTRDANRVVGKSALGWDYVSPTYPLLCPNHYQPSDIWGAKASGKNLAHWFWTSVGIAQHDVRVDIEPAGTNGMWFDRYDSNHMYLLDSVQKVYATVDGWTTINAPPTLSPGDFCGLWVPISEYPQHILLGRRSTLDLGAANPHTVHIMVDLDDNTPLGRAGSDPENASTMVSIPHTGHGVCEIGGIWVVR